MVAYAIQSPAPPFPVFAIAYVINGFGLSLQDAQANGYVSNYHTNTATLMGVMHGVYGTYIVTDSSDILLTLPWWATGLGALCSPLVATQFARQKHWSFHYLCSFGVGLINTVFLAVVFRFRDQDGALLLPKPCILCRSSSTQHVSRTLAKNLSNTRKTPRLRADSIAGCSHFGRYTLSPRSHSFTLVLRSPSVARL